MIQTEPDANSSSGRSATVALAGSVGIAMNITRIVPLERIVRVSDRWQAPVKRRDLVEGQ